MGSILDRLIISFKLIMLLEEGEPLLVILKKWI